jgi:hypothetical protein
VVIDITFNVGDSSLESGNPDDEGGKGMIDFLRSSASEVVATVHVFGTIKGHDLLDLPEWMHGA